MTEHLQAQAWRRKHNLTPQQLSALTGYSTISIYWFERGETPPGRGNNSRAPKEWVWNRYKKACAGVEAELRSGKEFKW